MAKGNNETLTAEQEMQLRKPIEDYVGEIQKKIDSLRADGTNKMCIRDSPQGCPGLSLL